MKTISPEDLPGYEARIDQLFAALLSADKEANEAATNPLGKVIRCSKFQKINKDKNEFKYWHCTLHEYGHVRRWGRIGTKGQKKEFPADSRQYDSLSSDIRNRIVARLAEEEFSQIVRKKIAEGYTEVR